MKDKLKATLGKKISQYLTILCSAIDIYWK